MAEAIPKLREFLLTYPGLEPGSDIKVLPFSPNITEGNGISYSGMGTPRFKKYTDGSMEVTYRETYSFDIFRHLIDERQNEEITEFIRNFEKWVTLQGVLNKAPKFGDTEFDEKIWAQNGILYMVQESETQIPFAIYRTNIIIEYTEFYERDDY